MPLVDDEIKFLRDFVAKRSGNQISAEQGYLLESRLAPVAENYGIASVNALVNELRRESPKKLSDEVAQALTINETSFFRDMHPFDALRTTIVPELIKKRANRKSLSIWCAACSAGQEPYSIAITLREHFPQLNDWKVRIACTDYSDEILEKAKSGRYSQFEVNRGLPMKLLIKHFERAGTQWKIKSELQQWMDFRKLNLIENFGFISKFDIIFIRNVLIYFSPKDKQSIIRRAHKILANDGYLFLGGGETVISLNVPFERKSIGQSVVFQPIANGT